MAEVLSQSQIDALLGALQENNSAEPEVVEKKKEYRKYDFYSPKKFTKDKLKILSGIYENYSRIASSQINSLFRVTSELEVVAVEEQRYYEFCNALSDRDIFSLIKIQIPEETKNPPMLIHVSQVLMVNWIDRMLGGVGDDSDIDSSYEYTEIEQQLYQRVMEYLIRPMKDSWGGYVRLDARFSRVEENPRLFQDIGMDETVVIIMLNVTTNEIQGRISICILGNLLSNIFSIMDKYRRTENLYGNQVRDYRADIMESICQSALEVKAELGGAKLSLKDIYNLKVGDVIDLNKPKDSDVSVLVGKQTWFTGQLGVHNKNVAVKLNTRVLEPASEEEEENIITDEEMKDSSIEEELIMPVQ